MKRRISLKTAKAQYVHRYTMEHVPAWALKACHNGKFYAPQYRTDSEWYDNTIFPGEGPEAGRDHCFSSGQTWPLGTWLDAPFKRQS